MPVRRGRTLSPQASDCESANDVFFPTQRAPDFFFQNEVLKPKINSTFLVKTLQTGHFFCIFAVAFVDVSASARIT